MSALDSKKTYQNLKSKGFVDKTDGGKDHKRLELIHNGKFILHTKLSHGGNEIGDYLIKQMSDQCHLSKDKFKDLANCPLSKQDFFTILEKLGDFD